MWKTGEDRKVDESKSTGRNKTVDLGQTVTGMEGFCVQGRKALMINKGPSYLLSDNYIQLNFFLFYINSKNYLKLGKALLKIRN